MFDEFRKASEAVFCIFFSALYFFSAALLWFLVAAALIFFGFWSASLRVCFIFLVGRVADSALLSMSSVSLWSLEFSLALISTTYCLNSEAFLSWASNNILGLASVYAWWTALCAAFFTIGSNYLGFEAFLCFSSCDVVSSYFWFFISFRIGDWSLDFFPFIGKIGAGWFGIVLLLVTCLLLVVLWILLAR